MTQQADRVREVVVGVDGADEARRALAWGFREAGLLDPDRGGSLVRAEGARR